MYEYPDPLFNSKNCRKQNFHPNHWCLVHMALTLLQSNHYHPMDPCWKFLTSVWQPTMVHSQLHFFFSFNSPQMDWIKQLQQACRTLHNSALPGTQDFHWRQSHPFPTHPLQLFQTWVNFHGWEFLRLMKEICFVPCLFWTSIGSWLQVKKISTITLIKSKLAFMIAHLMNPSPNCSN